VVGVPAVTVPLVSTVLCVVDMIRVLGMDRMDGGSAVLVVGHGSPPIVTQRDYTPKGYEVKHSFAVP
jgi:hypothetical protein